MGGDECEVKENYMKMKKELKMIIMKKKFIKSKKGDRTVAHDEEEEDDDEDKDGEGYEKC